MVLEREQLEQVKQRIEAIIAEVEKVIVGKRSVIELCVAALLSGGHVLIEDIPGVGKTTLAKSLAKALGCAFKRIQFTPDLLPGDITGVSVFDQKTGEFQFRAGPVFANVVLADEINRTTPRTQSALLECMEEAQVTVDGITHPLPQPFFVIATDNPIEHRGIYPLPESQLDRFLMKLHLGYPEHDEEVTVLTRQEVKHPIEDTQAVLSSDEVLALQKKVRHVHLTSSLKDYIVSIVEGTRQHPSVLWGTSPRGSLGLMRSSQAWAAMQGRGFVLPDDIKYLAPYVLSHRLILKPEATARNVKAEAVIEEILSKVPVPLTR